MPPTPLIFQEDIYMAEKKTKKTTEKPAEEVKEEKKQEEKPREQQLTMSDFFEEFKI